MEQFPWYSCGASVPSDIRAPTVGELRLGVSEDMKIHLYAKYYILAMGDHGEGLSKMIILRGEGGEDLPQLWCLWKYSNAKGFPIHSQKILNAAKYRHRD